MAETIWKIANKATHTLNDSEKATANNVATVAMSYYQENRDACDQIITNVESLATKNLPISAEASEYRFPSQRMQRLIDDFADICNNDNNENWHIECGSISEENSRPSKLSVRLKFNVLLTVLIDSQYPLKAPLCTFTMIKFFANHPCIDSKNNTIILFEDIWSPSLTLHDVVHFCSIIMLGEDPTDLVKTYVRISHNTKVKAMLRDGTMKDYLLKYTNPVCKCGAEMIQMRNTECYDVDVDHYFYVICDGCETICKKEYGVGKEVVYHCPNKQIQNIHPEGYDVCFDCVYNNHLRYRRFQALIIAPPKTDGNIDCEDASKLSEMFTSLKYHRVITLKDKETTKENIKRAIDLMYHNDEDANVNKVNIIVYTGHGERTLNDQFVFCIEGCWLSEMELKDWMYGHAKLPQHDAIDGYTKCKNALNATDAKSRFHRQNTLFLINACHSGAFQGLNERQNIMNNPDVMNQAISDASHQLGVDLHAVFVNAKPEDDEKDEQKEKSFLEFVEDGLNGILSEVSYNSHSALVISSCQKEEESSAFPGLSPFIEFVLDFLKESAQSIKRDSEPITSYEQLPDTPIKLYQYIHKRGNMPHPLNETAVILSDLAQNVTLASKRGTQQFVLCPLY
eukprot:237628_1